MWVHSRFKPLSAGSREPLSMMMNFMTSKAGSQFEIGTEAGCKSCGTGCGGSVDPRAACSIRLRQSLVPKVAVAGTLHDGLRTPQFYVGTKSLGRREVRAADQQEAELRLTKVLVEVGVAASRDVDLEGILRLLVHFIVERVLTGIGCERGRHDVSEVLRLL